MAARAVILLAFALITVGGTVFFLFLTVRSLESRKWR